MGDEISVEKETLEEIQKELCAIRRIVGEAISRLNQLEGKVSVLGQYRQALFDIKEVTRERGE